MLYKDKNWLYQKYYYEKLSTYEVAKLCNVAKNTILYWLEKFNIRKRLIDEMQKKGERSSRWKGGRIEAGKRRRQTKKYKEYMGKWYEKNKEKVKEQSNQRYQKNKEYVTARNRLWVEEHPYRAWANSTIGSHRRKGCKIEISGLELGEIAENTQNCYYCGCKLDYSPFKGKIFNSSPSLDRIDNGKIINKDTIHIVCKRCNTAKSDRTHEEFINYCKNIARKFG